MLKKLSNFLSQKPPSKNGRVYSNVSKKPTEEDFAKSFAKFGDLQKNDYTNSKTFFDLPDYNPFELDFNKSLLEILKKSQLQDLIGILIEDIIEKIALYYAYLTREGKLGEIVFADLNNQKVELMESLDYLITNWFLIKYINPREAREIANLQDNEEEYIQRLTNIIQKDELNYRNFLKSCLIAHNYFVRAIVVVGVVELLKLGKAN
jgi:hypothetical protein